MPELPHYLLTYVDSLCACLTLNSYVLWYMYLTVHSVLFCTLKVGCSWFVCILCSNKHACITLVSNTCTRIHTHVCSTYAHTHTHTHAHKHTHTYAYTYTVWSLLCLHGVFYICTLWHEQRHHTRTHSYSLSVNCLHHCQLWT